MEEVYRKSQKRLVFILALAVIGMFGFGFALVPIYNSLCKNFGINGKTNAQPIAYDPVKSGIDDKRVVVVEFVATNNGNVPWSFYSKTKKMRVHPGEIARLSFYAENRTDFTMTVQAIPSVTPGLAAKYLKKNRVFLFSAADIGWS